MKKMNHAFQSTKTASQDMILLDAKNAKNQKLTGVRFHWKKRIFNRVKNRAKLRNIPFDITVEYIKSIIPDKCPVFGSEFVYGDHKLTYSLDRIDPSKGYIVGNCQILSNKANMIKGDYCAEDILKVYEFMSKQKHNNIE